MNILIDGKIFAQSASTTLIAHWETMIPMLVKRWQTDAITYIHYTPKPDFPALTQLKQIQMNPDVDLETLCQDASIQFVLLTHPLNLSLSVPCMTILWEKGSPFKQLDFIDTILAMDATIAHSIPAGMSHNITTIYDTTPESIDYSKIAYFCEKTRKSSQPAKTSKHIPPPTEKEDHLIQQSGELDIIKKFIKPGSTVFDIGANTGKWSTYVRQAKENITLHIFEPIPDLYAQIAITFSKSIHDKKTFITNTAIGKHLKNKKFFVYSQAKTLSSLYRRGSEIERQIIKDTPKEITVPVDTLDHYCEQHAVGHIDFLKVDVEGAELDVFEGAQRMLRESRIDLIQFEYGGTFADAGITLEQVYVLLKTYDYLLFKILPSCQLNYRPTFNPAYEDYQYSNYLAVPKRLENTLFSDQLKTNDLPTITMSTLGQNGRFANQAFQYAFLKIYVRQHQLQLQVPRWIGNDLFGHTDPQITRQLPLIKDGSSDVYQGILINSTPPLKNIDLWGYFQYHTSFYKPHQTYFRSLFQPLERLAAPLNQAIQGLKNKGKTIIGLHLRRSDYGVGHHFIAPSSWYLDWLAKIWNTLEDPVLYLASDELEKIKEDFAEYNPVTTHDLGLTLQGAEFYLDFYTLTRCDVLAISNSSFSFLASMLNTRAHIFARPQYQSQQLIAYDPWNAEVIFHDIQQPIGKAPTPIIRIEPLPPQAINLVSYCCHKYPDNYGGVARYDYQLSTVFPNRKWFQGPQQKDQMLAFLRKTSNPIIITDNHLACDIPNEYPTILVHHGCARTHADRDPKWDPRTRDFIVAGQDAMLSYRDPATTLILSISQFCSDEFRKYYAQTYQRFQRIDLLSTTEFPDQIYKKTFNPRPVIIGNWPDYNKGQHLISPLAQRLGGEFIFRGIGVPGMHDTGKHNQHKAHAYASADIFLSLSLSEGFGYTIADAMASGLLVIGTDTGLLYKDAPADTAKIFPWEQRDDLDYLAMLVRQTWQDRETNFYAGRNWILKNHSFTVWQKTFYEIVTNFYNQHYTNKAL